MRSILCTPAAASVRLEMCCDDRQLRELHGLQLHHALDVDAQPRQDHSRLRLGWVVRPLVLAAAAAAPGRTWRRPTPRRTRTRRGRRSGRAAPRTPSGTRASRSPRRSTPRRTSRRRRRGRSAGRRRGASTPSGTAARRTPRRATRNSARGSRRVAAPSVSPTSRRRRSTPSAAPRTAALPRMTRTEAYLRRRTSSPVARSPRASCPRVWRTKPPGGTSRRGGGNRADRWGEPRGADGSRRRFRPDSTGFQSTGRRPHRHR